MKFSRLFAVAASLSLTVGQASAATCIPETQANALFVAVLPGFVGSLGKRCKPHLPADARLVNSAGTINKVYKPASEAAWPLAAKAFGGLLGTKLPAGADPKIFAPLAEAFVVTAITEKVELTDCPVAEKIYSALEPLPPQNLATLLVTFIQEGKMRSGSGRTAERKPSFDICPTPPGL